MANLDKASDAEVLVEFQRRFVPTSEAAAILGLVGRAGVGYHARKNLDLVATVGGTNVYRRAQVEDLAVTLTHKRTKKEHKS